MRKYSFICKVCYGPYSSTHRYSNVCPHCGNKDNTEIARFFLQKILLPNLQAGFILLE